MNRMMTGLVCLGLIALASCASTGERDNASLKTALASTVAPAMPIVESNRAIEEIMTGSIEDDASTQAPKVKLSSIHSVIVPGAAENDRSLPVQMAATGDLGDYPMAGRTIYLDRTRDIELAPKEVVLTFDDGPVPHNTRAVLDALDQHGVKGLFFMVGEMAHYHPEEATMVVEDGQTIGSHTYSHPKLPKIDFTQAVEDIDKGRAAVEQATGEVPHFFRFPYLAENNALDLALDRRAMIPVGIDVDSRDYEPNTTAEIVDRVMAALNKRGGGIVLMHDLQRRTAKAIGPLLDRLEAEGYKVVTLKYGEPPAPEPRPLLAGLFPKPDTQK